MSIQQMLLFMIINLQSILFHTVVYSMIHAYHGILRYSSHV